MKKIMNGAIASIGLLVLLLGSTELNSQYYPGITEEDNNSDFELYPNPTANVINLKSSLQYEGYDRFVIVSYEGLHIMTKIVNDISAETEYSFDMSNIPIGKYYIIAEGKFGQMQIGSFVKE
jgi:hypothetical protein